MPAVPLAAMRGSTWSRYYPPPVANREASEQRLDGLLFARRWRENSRPLASSADASAATGGAGEIFGGRINREPRAIAPGATAAPHRAAIIAIWAAGGGRSHKRVPTEYS